jgi:hypothetical protein
MTAFGIDRGSTEDKTRALRAAMRKIQQAENVVDRILTYQAPAEQTQRLIAIRSDIRAIVSLINARLQTMS